MEKQNEIKIFEDKKVRTLWDEENEKWYFSIRDVIALLTHQPGYQGARNYWKVLKHRLAEEGNEPVTNCNGLKMQAFTEQSVGLNFVYLISEKTSLDFVIDKLTNSIENVVTGDNFQTDITLISNADLKTVTKKNGWAFDWRSELKEPARDVYKLTIVNNQSVIQGLISVEVKSDHVYVHLVESAPMQH